MPEYVIVKYEDNWADEFDVETTWIVRKEVFEAWANLVTEKITEEQEIYFGTNEYITIHSGKEVVDACTVLPIPENEARILLKWLGAGYESIDTEVGFEIGQIHIFASLRDKINDE
jgi:hypothetical protein